MGLFIMCSLFYVTCLDPPHPHFYPGRPPKPCRDIFNKYKKMFLILTYHEINVAKSRMSHLLSGMTVAFESELTEEEYAAVNSGQDGEIRT
jgi:hypothetical protein